MWREREVGMCLSKPSSCFGSYLRQELHTLSFSGELSSKVPSLTGFLEHPSFGFRDINVISSHYYYFLDVFIYLAEPGLSYNTWDLPSSLWPVGALVVAYRIFFFFSCSMWDKVSWPRIEWECRVSATGLPGKFPHYYFSLPIIFDCFLTMASLVLKHLPAMWETRVRSLGWEDLLEKEMAAHSSTLAWKMPWTEEAGRLQSMGSQRVGRDWATSVSLFLTMPVLL